VDTVPSDLSQMEHIHYWVYQVEYEGRHKAKYHIQFIYRCLGYNHCHFLEDSFPKSFLIAISILLSKQNTLVFAEAYENITRHN